MRGATFEQFEDMDSWKLARQLTKEIYTASKTGTFAQDFGLRNQMCRASASIMSNIAEGFERNGTKEFIQYLAIAKGSAGEIRSQLYIALDQQYIDRKTFEHLTGLSLEISKKLSGLMKYLRQTELNGSKYK